MVATEAGLDAWRESERRAMQWHRTSELPKPGARPAPSLWARVAGFAWPCWPPLKGCNPSCGRSPCPARPAPRARPCPISGQALGWRTILAKRENFRRAFLDFNYNKVAGFTEDDVARLLLDKGIVRHRGKIEAVINNAQRAVELVKAEGSLAAYVWRFEPKPGHTAEPQTASTSAESIALSKALKKQGWKFVGPTTCYAFMQAMGLINDHVEECVIRARVASRRKRFHVPRS